MTKRQLSIPILASLLLVACGGCSNSSTSSTTAAATAGGGSSTTSTFSGTLTSGTKISPLASNSRHPDSLDEYVQGSIDEMTGNYIPRLINSDSVGVTIRCKTTDTDQTIYTGTIGPDGSFSLDIPKSTPLRCEVLDATPAVIGTFVINLTSEKAMSGANKNMDTFLSGGNMDAGNLILDPYKQMIEIDEATIAAALASANVTDPWDFTNTYEASAIADIPVGYDPLCVLSKEPCQGPAVGDNFYVKRLDGYAVDGAGDATDTRKYGIAVWQSAAAAEACGNKLGFTYAEGKTAAKIDLTGSGVGEGVLDWSESIAPTSDITGWNGKTIVPAGVAVVEDGWKIKTALSGYDMQNCITVDVETKTHTFVPGWQCEDRDGNHQISIGGGCVDASGSPINVTDWSGMKCETTDSSLYEEVNEEAYQVNTCTRTVEKTIEVTCTSTFLADPGFNWGDIDPLVTEGQTCASIVPPKSSDDKLALAQLRCYAEAFWRYIESLPPSELETTCFRNLSTDWSATTADTFLVDVPDQANTQFVTELFDYTSNLTGGFRNEREESRGIQVSIGENQTIWVNCRILNVMTMGLTKVSDSQLLAEMITEIHAIDTKDSCKTSDAYTALGVGTDGKSVSRTLFHMDVQK